VAALALLVAAGASGVARADNSPTSADDQYNQQPVLTPPTNTPTQQPSAAMTPASQNSPPAVTPPAQQTPAAPATTPSSTPSTPAAAKTTPAAPKSTPQTPLTPPKVSTSTPAQTPTQSAAPATGTQGQSLPFTGIPLLDVVFVGLGLIALGAVLRLPQSRFGKRS
jgi:hypothetical protein